MADYIYVYTSALLSWVSRAALWRSTPRRGAIISGSMSDASRSIPSGSGTSGSEPSSSESGPSSPAP